jgi:hypothetical protein
VPVYGAYPFNPRALHLDQMTEEIVRSHHVAIVFLTSSVGQRKFSKRAAGSQWLAS